MVCPHITTPTGSLKSIKYPMAGQASEKPSVGIYNVKTGKTVYIKPTGKANISKPTIIITFVSLLSSEP